MNKRLGKSKLISQPALKMDGVFEQEGKSASRSFYRGENCNFNPYKKDFANEDFLQNYVLKGWLPEEPLIDHDTKITAFGSCFAANISKHLSTVGYNVSKAKNTEVYISSIGEGLVNVHALLSQFRWAFDGHVPSQELWHGYKAETFEYDESIRLKTKEIFLNTDFFIITLGLSEVWFDSVTNEYFWRAIPQDKFDPKRHQFKVCSMAESKDALQKILNYINDNVPNAKVLFTMSPVPLAATFRPVSCLTANSVSKSVLRAALDEMIRDNEELLNKKLFYWPSYEIVKELFVNEFTEDNRHPHPDILAMIMRLFESQYCRSNIDVNEIEAQYKNIRKNNIASIKQFK